MTIQIRMGGYGPSTTGFSRALKLIGDRLTAQFGDRIDIKYVWNIMDLGYRAEDILWLVEQSHRPGPRAWPRRPSLPVQGQRSGTSRDRRRARESADTGDRGSYQLPHPRLFREWLPPYLQSDPR